MPLYEFEHAIRLTVTQRQALASAITDYHALTFNAPRFIVNCRFVDVSQGPLSNTFVGGQPSQINRLFVSLRSGTGRTPAQLQGLSDKLESIWDEVVGKGPREQRLRGIYIKGTLDAAKEGGFHLPMPGHFEQWVKDNTEEFKKLAAAGDPDFIQLVKEIRTRPVFQK
ncbi:hypothetical protein G7Z17_g3635 [Cylindrodendrum hubeiense]|uniref:Tautomerase cis-CaaD-like domain-containing protein n=1 Tax=Cylindrodendrum hubeiense TaxID=595255 RepID=A0A9P5LJ49_9HYPO|nr:hypothetical protein G7Z17_g3635 [Cylindrodendrum hubeiense]